MTNSSGKSDACFQVPPITPASGMMAAAGAPTPAEYWTTSGITRTRRSPCGRPTPAVCPALRRLALGLLLLGFPLQGHDSGAPPALRVNAERLRSASTGWPASEGLPRGWTRLAFTEADLRGREYVTRLMQEAGLQVRVDAAGNLSGHRQGRQPVRPAIVLGSHIDTVPLAGHYDGVLGVMAAIECVQVLGGAWGPDPTPAGSHCLCQRRRGNDR